MNTWKGRQQHAQHTQHTSWPAEVDTELFAHNANLLVNKHTQHLINRTHFDAFYVPHAYATVGVYTKGAGTHTTVNNRQACAAACNAVPHLALACSR